VVVTLKMGQKIGHFACEVCSNQDISMLLNL
jgi:hypothetical protein